MEWVKITDINALDIPRNERYLVAVESFNGHQNDWYYLTANFYYSGDTVNLIGNGSEARSHNIYKTGFYYFVDVGPEQYRRVYLINNVHYYAVIDKPEKSPDDILTIV